MLVATVTMLPRFPLAAVGDVTLPGRRPSDDGTTMDVLPLPVGVTGTAPGPPKEPPPPRDAAGTATDLCRMVCPPEVPEPDTRITCACAHGDEFLQSEWCLRV